MGHGVGSDALAAVNIVAPLFLISSGIGLLFGIGSSVVSSIHLAKGNVHAANLNITQASIASFMIGMILGIVVLSFQREMCLLFGCSEVLIPLASSYLKWIAVVMAMANIILPAIIGTSGLWLAAPLAEALTLLIILSHYFIKR